ncbi:MAG: hypothetical protein PHN88_01285 [Ignavibacteria bacterium]|nr:hypothetical protein [Ignavibacteria bacterium]
MKTKNRISFTILSVLLSYSMFSQIVLCQKSDLINIYNNNTVTTISGQIINIDKIYHDANMNYSERMTISTADGEILILLGPAIFIENQEFQINTNDYVTVVGSMIIFNDSSEIIAKTISKSGKIYKIRDDNGNPLWNNNESIIN